MSDGRQVEVPQGLEKLVAVAALSPEWRAKVLADPLAAADEAELKFTDNERAVIKSVTPDALAGMIDSFGKSVPRPSGLGRLAAGAAAAGAAAAALLAATLTGCGDGGPVGTQGIQPDVPPEKPRKVEPAPPATEGIRPDVPESKPRDVKPAPPATRGMRSDLPEKRG